MLTSRASRTVVLATVVLVMGVALVFLSAAVPSTADASSCLAGHACDTDQAAPTPMGDGTGTTPCLRSASCGGGGLMTGGGVAVLAVLGAAIVLVVPSIGVRRGPVWDLTLDGRLTAARLFRPPRPSF